VTTGARPVNNGSKPAIGGPQGTSGKP
jgi:hypothetical protein